MAGELFLIPAPLGDKGIHTIAPYVREIVHGLTHFAVEHEKTARRYLKQLDYPISFDDITLLRLDKRSGENEVLEYLQILLSGTSIGILSEAGCPGIADPGSLFVEMAHQNSIKVTPLVGPSSMFLALMASGMNGQQFTFHGYLSPRPNERKKDIQRLEQTSLRTGATQLFMETPYRNMALLDDILKHGCDHTRLCIACDITLPTEFIATKPVELWRKQKPNLHKRPAVFLIGR